MKGKVRWFTDQKGCGFIEQPNGKDDVFVHRSGIIGGYKMLSPGDSVTFDIEEGAKGLCAVSVKVINE